MKAKLIIIRLLLIVLEIVMIALIVMKLINGENVSASNWLTAVAPIVTFIATYVPDISGKKKKNIEQIAVKYLENAFDGHPKEKKQFLNGFTFWHLGKHSEAIDCLNRLAKKTEDSAILARVHSQIGRCWLDMGRYTNSAKSFEEATTYDPSFVIAWSNLATVYEKLGESPEKSISALETAIFYDPDYEIAYNKLGMYYSMANNNERSEWATRNAIKLNPTRAVNYSNLAWTLCAMGRAEEAEQNYLKALSLGYKDNGALRDTIVNAKAVTAQPAADGEEEYYEDEE